MSTVRYEKRDRVTRVTLNRPDALNALDDELNRELWEIWRDFAEDPGVDVAILTGAGKAFCAGADLKTYIPRWANANMMDVRENVAYGIGGGLTRGRHRIAKPRRRRDQRSCHRRRLRAGPGLRHRARRAAGHD